MKRLPITRALMSVTDKSHLAGFARFLHEGGVQIVSTGGTRRHMEEAGLPVTSVSEVTGFPEIMDGRVKTLHPHVHGGILADKDNPAHLNALDELGITPFSLVCVNLYAFDQAVSKGLGLKESIELVDIGGPCMLRAAAKNFHSMLVITDVADYARVQEELAANDFTVSLALRHELAVKTFALTSRYDAMIAEYLGQQTTE